MTDKQATVQRAIAQIQADTTMSVADKQDATNRLNPDSIAEEAERIGAALQAMEHSLVARLSVEGVDVSFHGDGRVTGSHKLKSFEAAHAILDLGRKVHGPLWQPIETAPKTGGTVVRLWSAEDGSPDACGYWSRASPVKGWTLSSMGELVYDMEGNPRHFDAPTHWAPLPEPPEAA